MKIKRGDDKRNDDDLYNENYLKERKSEWVSELQTISKNRERKPTIATNSIVVIIKNEKNEYLDFEANFISKILYFVLDLTHSFIQCALLIFLILK